MRIKGTGGDLVPLLIPLLEGISYPSFPGSGPERYEEVSKDVLISP